jgi:hypothetical protein
MFGLTTGDLHDTLSRTLRLYRKERQHDCIKARLNVSLAVTPTTAVAQVDMEKDAIGADYTDFQAHIMLNDTCPTVATIYHKYEG